MEEAPTNEKEDENRVIRSNRILQGIKRIFSSIKQAKTEEDLGNTCLSVAIDITGSQIGFISELISEYKLHDISISDMGWNQCKIYDRAGYGRFPSHFIIRGLYGQVINSGKSLFNNKPLSHRNSINLPPGHPSLISFLGVPLIENGKVVGIIAVANCEGGYSYEQMEDLEAIAQVVLEALHRIKDEKALHEAYEQIKTQSEELQTQSDELQKVNETLEEKVKERTTELEQAYESLKEVEIARKQEIHHRIKNNLQVISSLLDLEAEKFRGKKNIEDLQVLEAFKESQDRVISMALIHEELYKGGKLDTLNFSHYVEELADNLLLTYRLDNEGISLYTDIEDDIFFDMDTAVPLGIIVNELISNSLKYAFIGRDEGEITIKLSGGGKLGEYIDKLEKTKTKTARVTVSF